MALDLEDAVVYQDGNGHERILRGHVIEETPEYVTVERRDGTWRIARRSILRIRFAPGRGRP